MNKLFYPELIGLDSIYSKILYLQELCNKYGDFFITTSKRDEEGNVIFWKHRSVFECWESEKGLWFLNQATHRTSLKCEIILDMDEEPSEYKLNECCNWIERKFEFPYKAYFTGSRGYHIHIIVKEFITDNYSNKEIYQLRKTMMGRYEGISMDEHKSSSKSMIALEGCPHWKTGNIKQMVRSFQ